MLCRAAAVPPFTAGIALFIPVSFFCCILSYLTYDTYTSNVLVVSCTLCCFTGIVDAFSQRSRILPPFEGTTHLLYSILFYFITSKYIFLLPSHLLSSPFYSLSLLAVTQIRGHIAGSSPPLPTTVRALYFYREKISALSSLVDSRRIALTHARRSQQLILFYFCT